MTEIDTPGHSSSWGAGYPEVVTHCPAAIQKSGAGVVSLDPSENQTFAVIEQLFIELAGIFPDDTFHLGGDEVRFACWSESAKVKAFMLEKGFSTDFDKLELYYEHG
eukprot:gene10934-11867_t